MSRLESEGISTTTAIVILIIIACIAAGGAWWYYGPSSTPSVPANLSATITSYDLVANAPGYVAISIQNTGGSASGVTANVTIDGTTLSSSPVNIAANSSRTINATGTCPDLNYGHYNATVTASGDDISATYSSGSVYVAPSIQIINVAWEEQQLSTPLGSTGIPFTSKSTVGPTDNTQITFEVQSSSTYTYSGLTVQAVVGGNSPTSTIVFTINPNVDPIGPQGKTGTLTLGISTHDTPSGTYPIVIQILANGQIATGVTEDLTVSS